jgi:hypothetical protein
MGANIVHMTMLHELVASAASYVIGTYYVMSNNLHIYPDLVPHYDNIRTRGVPLDHYYMADVKPVPLLANDETYHMLVADAELLCKGGMKFTTWWMDKIAYPMSRIYHARKEGLPHVSLLNRMPQNSDWRLACEEWINRRTKPGVSTDGGGSDEISHVEDNT